MKSPDFRGRQLCRVTLEVYPVLKIPTWVNDGADDDILRGLEGDLNLYRKSRETGHRCHLELQWK